MNNVNHNDFLDYIKSSNITDRQKHLPNTIVETPVKNKQNRIDIIPKELGKLYYTNNSTNNDTIKKNHKAKRKYRKKISDNIAHKNIITSDNEILEEYPSLYKVENLEHPNINTLDWSSIHSKDTRKVNMENITVVKSIRSEGVPIGITLYNENSDNIGYSYEDRINKLKTIQHKDINNQKRNISKFRNTKRSTKKSSLRDDNFKQTKVFKKDITVQQIEYTSSKIIKSKASKTNDELKPIVLKRSTKDNNSTESVRVHPLMFNSRSLEHNSYRYYQNPIYNNPYNYGYNYIPIPPKHINPDDIW